MSNPRSDKDPVPEFDSAEDALAWMNAKLDGSWVDAITDEPKPADSFRTPPATVTINPSATTAIQYNGDPKDLITGSTPASSINPTSTGYRPDMTADELAAFLHEMWSKDDGESS